jgi:hypothetical protein
MMSRGQERRQISVLARQARDRSLILRQITEGAARIDAACEAWLMLDAELREADIHLRDYERAMEIGALAQEIVRIARVPFTV